MKDDVKKLSAEDRASAPALIAGTSPREAAELLFGLLLDVARKHQPEIEPLLKGGAAVTDVAPELMARALQAQGIWFQLLSIAEQNAAMRRRRQVERERGREELRGTFSHVLSEAARGGVGPEEIQKLISNLRIRPVLTAHPTESEARHRAGEIPQDLSPVARAGKSALDGAGARAVSSTICAIRSSSCG